MELTGVSGKMRLFFLLPGNEFSGIMVHTLPESRCYKMKYTNIQRIWKAPLYIRKKHRCPVCAAPVNAAKRDKIVRAGSEEAKRLNVTGMSGNVKVIWDVFECPDCGAVTSIEDMKRHEGIPL